MGRFSHFILNLIISALAIAIAAYLLPGVHIAGVGALIVTAVVLGFINAFLRPVLHLFTLPVTILSLGLFAFVINGGLVLLAGALVSGFDVDSFWWAVLFGVVLWLVHAVLDRFTEEPEKKGVENF